MLSRRSIGADRIGRAKNILVIYEQGGLSHIDTFDPKPEAAADHRSPHQPIATSVPGIQFTSLCQKTATVADKLTSSARCITRVVESTVIPMERNTR